MTGWWFGTWLLYDFPIILGMSSSQLTNSMILQRGWNHQPDESKISGHFLFGFFFCLRIWCWDILHFRGRWQRRVICDGFFVEKCWLVSWRRKTIAIIIHISTWVGKWDMNGIRYEKGIFNRESDNCVGLKKGNTGYQNWHSKWCKIWDNYIC